MALNKTVPFTPSYARGVRDVPQARRFIKHMAHRVSRIKARFSIREQLNEMEIERRVAELTKDRRFYAELKVDGKRRKFNPAEAEVSFYQDFDAEMEHDFNLRMLNDSKYDDPFYDAWEDWKADEPDDLDVDIDPEFYHGDDDEEEEHPWEKMEHALNQHDYDFHYGD